MKTNDIKVFSPSSPPRKSLDAADPSASAVVRCACMRQRVCRGKHLRFHSCRHSGIQLRHDAILRKSHEFPNFKLTWSLVIQRAVGLEIAICNNVNQVSRSKLLMQHGSVEEMPYNQSTYLVVKNSQSTTSQCFKTKTCIHTLRLQNEP